MPYFCGCRPFARPKLPDQHLRKAAARTLSKQRVLGAQFHAAGEACLVVSILADAHVAGGNAGDRSILEQQLGGGEARIDLDAKRFGFLRQMAANVAERDDEIAVIAHERRQQKVRQPHRTGGSEHVEAIGGDRASGPELLRCAIPG